MSPTRAAGRLPAPHPQSRRPPAASWLPSWAAPSEAPAGPRRRHLQAGGGTAEGAEVTLTADGSSGGRGKGERLLTQLFGSAGLVGLAGNRK